MFALGVAAGLFTAHLEASHVGAAGPEWNYAPAQRLLIAGRSLWFYVAKIAWPVNLAFMYEKWPADAAWQWIFPIAAVAVIATLFALRHRLGRGPTVAALIFAGTLVPALGFVNVYPMRYTFVADHYQYHASIALIALLVASVATLLDRAAVRRRAPYARPIVVGVVVLALFVLTLRQASIYKDSATLWADTLAKSPNSWMAWVNSGKVAATRVPPDKAAALAAYRKAEQLAPDVADPHYLIGVAHLDRDDVPAALAEFTRAADLEPRHASSLNMKGYCLVRLGKPDDGIALYRRAIELEPRFADPRFNLGVALRDQGRLDDAAKAYADCAAIDPNRAVAWRELADCRVKQKRFGDAIAPLERYLELSPDDAKAHLDLSRLLAAAGRNDEAMSHINRAVQLNPRIAQPPPKP
jgi:Flp pilus assembly protein TadD